MRIPVQLKNIPPVKHPDYRLWQGLQQIYQQVARIVNGNVNFVPTGDYVNQTSTTSPMPSDNTASTSIVYTTGTAGSDDTLVHNLGRIPYGFHVVSKTASVDVYDSPTSSTNTNIYLRSTLAGVTVKVLVY